MLSFSISLALVAAAMASFADTLSVIHGCPSPGLAGIRSLNCVMTHLLTQQGWETRLTLCHIRDRASEARSSVCRIRQLAYSRFSAFFRNVGHSGRSFAREDWNW